jgi:hypothetical protein
MRKRNVFEVSIEKYDAFFDKEKENASAKLASLVGGK